MFRIQITCDFCGNEIVGEYRKIRQEYTNQDEAGESLDMCLNCLKMVTDYKRMPVLNPEDLKEIENE